MQVAHIEDRALNAHLARADRFAELDEMSFAELLSLEDDLSEGSQWSLLDDVRAELRDRRSDAASALRKLFVEQCKVGGELPAPDVGKVATQSMQMWFKESLGAQWGDMATEALFGVIDRERLFRAMAAEFAELVCEDLLKAGWSAQ